MDRQPLGGSETPMSHHLIGAAIGLAITLVLVAVLLVVAQ